MISSRFCENCFRDTYFPNVTNGCVVLKIAVFNRCFPSLKFFQSFIILFCLTKFGKARTRNFSFRDRPIARLIYPPPIRSWLGSTIRTNIRYELKSNELTLEGPWVSSALSFIGGVHIGARALQVLNLIWFGSIARLSQWGGGGSFPRSNDFYLPSLRVEGGGGVGTLGC